MNKKRIYRHPLVIIIMFVVLMAQATWPGDVRALSLEEERRLGREFNERLSSANLLVSNERLNRYLRQVGERLLSTVERPPFDFHYFLVRSMAINAFATPGGYVYINLGLFQLAENEAQLASVLSHEIIHVTRRHIASTLERSQRVSMATMLAVIAGALLGGGGDLTAAAASFSLAAGTSLQLKYSREQEEESDRLGLEMLASAGYSPDASIIFMRNMRRHDFLSKNVPSYFMTHPGIDDRIRYLDSLIATRYSKPGATEIIGNFPRMKTLVTLEDDDTQRSLRFFTANLQRNPDSLDDLLGLAMSQKRLGHLQDAILNFRRILGQNASDQDALSGLGAALFNAGRSQEAIPVLQQALSLDNTDFLTLSFLGRSYLSVGDNIAAVLTLEKGLAHEEGQTAEYYHQLATAYGRVNQPGKSHYYFGRSFSLRDRKSTAIHHYQQALKHLDPGSELFEDAQREIKTLTEKPPPKPRRP